MFPTCVGKQIDELHVVVDALTETDVQLFWVYFGSFIPCIMCSEHYEEDHLNEEVAIPKQFANSISPVPGIKWTTTPNHSYLRWLWMRRKHISQTQTGRKIYSFDECNKEFSAPGVASQCWDSLMLVCFGYPIVPEQETMDKAVYVFSRMGKWWPNLTDEQRVQWVARTSKNSSWTSRSTFIDTMIWIRTTFGNDQRVLTKEQAALWTTNYLNLPIEDSPGERYPMMKSKGQISPDLEPSQRPFIGDTSMWSWRVVLGMFMIVSATLFALSSLFVASSLIPLLVYLLSLVSIFVAYFIFRYQERRVVSQK